ncbi:MAG: hypothetical protein IK062_07465 [Selenomonadaceae bacterium]|nr:hypothetical protein [Selenomonadaceae bacterium]
MTLFDIITDIVVIDGIGFPRYPRYSEPAVWEEIVTERTTVSEDELPPAIRQKLARKSSNYNFSKTIDDDTTVIERKVSEEYVREQARKFNRPIKRG